MYAEIAQAGYKAADWNGPLGYFVNWIILKRRFAGRPSRSCGTVVEGVQYQTNQPAATEGTGGDWGTDGLQQIHVGFL